MLCTGLGQAWCTPVPKHPGARGVRGVPVHDLRAGASRCRNIRALRAGNPPAKPSSCCFLGVVTVSAGVRREFDGSSAGVRWANGGIFWGFELYALPTVLSSQVEFSVVTIFFFLNIRQRTEGTGGSCPNSEPQKMPSFPHHSPIIRPSFFKNYQHSPKNSHEKACPAWPNGVG